MSSFEVESLLKSAMSGGMAPEAVQKVIADDLYALPTRKWVAGTFAQALADNLKKLGASTYVSEKNDCDKFALYSMSIAKLCMNLTTEDPCSLAFGMIGYVRDGFPPVSHAINIAIVDENGSRQVMFFEPQLRVEVTLSPSELDSVFFYYI